MRSPPCPCRIFRQIPRPKSVSLVVGCKPKVRFKDQSLVCLLECHYHVILNSHDHPKLITTNYPLRQIEPYLTALSIKIGQYTRLIASGFATNGSMTSRLELYLCLVLVM